MVSHLEDSRRRVKPWPRIPLEAAVVFDGAITGGPGAPHFSKGERREMPVWSTSSLNEDCQTQPRPVSASTANTSGCTRCQQRALESGGSAPVDGAPGQAQLRLTAHSHQSAGSTCRDARATRW